MICDGLSSLGLSHLMNLMSFMAAADAMMAIDDDARCNGVTLYDRFVEYTPQRRFTFTYKLYHTVLNTCLMSAYGSRPVW